MTNVTVYLTRDYLVVCSGLFIMVSLVVVVAACMNSSRISRLEERRAAEWRQKHHDEAMEYHSKVFNIHDEKEGQ